jgi:hypothetical protein
MNFAEEISSRRPTLERREIHGSNTKTTSHLNGGIQLNPFSLWMVSTGNFRKRLNV